MALLHLLRKIFASLKTLQTPLLTIRISAVPCRGAEGLTKAGSRILLSADTVITKEPDVVRKKIAAVLLPVLAAVASLAVSWQR